MPESIFLKVMFDSSHFTIGTPVEVTLRVFTIPSGWSEVKSDPDPIVSNKLMMFEHPDPAASPDASLVVYGLMIGKNYSLYLQNGGAWSKTQYFSALNGSNVVFYAGHGSQMSHAAGDGGQGMTPNGYLEARESQIGSGVPPFNTGAPPVNFCHLLACNCGDTNAFTTVCYPYYMAWGGPWMENQALMSYTIYTYLPDYATHTDKIWGKLALGWTAAKTKQWFNDVWLPLNPEVLRVADVDPGDGGSWRWMEPGDLALYCNQGPGGDMGAMRIKTVYTGNHNDPAGWFMPL